MRRQTATRKGCDLVRRSRRSDPTMFERDAIDAWDPTYASVCIIPLNLIPRETFTYFYVGLCMTLVLRVRRPVIYFPRRGRTGFDSSLETQAACRGWFVGLVKNRTKTNKRRSPRSRSRGLIDRDVWSWTPATAPNVDSRLIGRRSDRAGR